MYDGFIKVAAGVPCCTVADVAANTNEIKRIIDKADELKVNLLTLPELCVTGYSCGDLFFSDTLISSARETLTELAEYTRGKYSITVLGLPVRYLSKLYNCAAVIFDGKILGIVPKSRIPNHAEFSEMRYFASGDSLNDYAVININGEDIPFGSAVFSHESLSEYSFAPEICEDIWAASQTAEILSLNGANIILNLSASSEAVGKAEYRKKLIEITSARLLCGYAYASAGAGESTQDSVCGGSLIIAENGTVLAENPPFGEKDLIISEIDVKKLSGERIKNTSFKPENDLPVIYFNQEIRENELTRSIEKSPFMPKAADAESRAEDILQIQSHGLKRRLVHTHAACAVIGISGGLDSTLALLVAVRAMKLLGRPCTDILAVTMPCFGTTSRTRSNSEKLCKLLGVSFSEVNIKAAVAQHFKDIGHNPDIYDVTYENSQARERTQVLMDIANEKNGLVIGTGDLSELALGWATYNGDHMSMYGVNVGVPKTIIRHIVRYEAEKNGGELMEVLFDILDTPVSPELLPADDKGEIAQKTEALVGPYELHDFFIYHMLRFGESPEKIYRLAQIAFEGIYSKETIKKWLTVFIRRFFTQQFKRSCLPDGPKVGSVSLSPRGDLKMPTDAAFTLWLKNAEEL